ncbi:cytidine deaminase-like protein [Rhizodiscina lignyota]|uniref:Cytidine deaminase-like protein n=1 Tax=Rhizodiscina lignyota TaxID=1504668 RepID=A0A9P4I9J9_9PEZI|nr:cytidine deaminase-like protein [Rhizodiscina lignyota]
MPYAAQQGCNQSLQNFICHQNRPWDEPNSWSWPPRGPQRKFYAKCLITAEFVKKWKADVYIVKIPVKSSNAVIKILKDGIPDPSPTDLQHLRRIVRPKFLPPHILAQFPNSETGQDVAFLFACHTSLIPLSELQKLLNQHDSSPFHGIDRPPLIITIAVPAYAPTTSVQAADWTQRYWPISYKNTNPYGPHPASVGREEAELYGKSCVGVNEKMELAEDVARQAEEIGIGERTGCIIVAQSQEGFASEETVAVAGDARWCSETTSEAKCADCRGAGNVMAHAVLRAIAMVAQKRLRIATTPVESSDRSASSQTTERTVFRDHPMTALESKYFGLDNLAPNGYLCVDLDIYITHEPCVMCAMAIVHSRFSRCIFAKRMPLTGAMTADEKGLGHGLFWRPAELNWKLMCWEWQCDEEGEEKDDIDERLNV